jgi:hypothetical protein
MASHTISMRKSGESETTRLERAEVITGDLIQSMKWGSEAGSATLDA